VIVTLEEFTPLLQYPDEGYASRASRIAALAGSAPLRAFAEAVSRLTASEIQELFIRTFDLNPACTLEIGWHLFGEQYERGEFLVDDRGLLRRAGVTEIGELPDHLLHVLPLIARMSSPDAAEFSRRFLAPALTKMAGALAKDNPFALSLAGLLEAVAAMHEPVGAGGAA
jgi:nitrate reductase assembly molybdenum cofactor insertion protein NarJ